MIELFAGTVEVHYGQAYIELDGPFGGDMDASFVGQSNGLIGVSAAAILFLITGLHTGPVGLTINLHDAAPELDESWEEIVEVPFHVSNGDITLVEWGADQGVRMVVPSGDYRARYHGNAMEAASDLDTNTEEDPVDHYRLDLWPASPAPDRIVKQTSAVAAYWHEWAGNLAGAKP